MTGRHDPLDPPRPNWAGMLAVVLVAAGVVALAQGAVLVLGGGGEVEQASAEPSGFAAAPPTTTTTTTTTVAAAPDEPPLPIPAPTGIAPVRVRIPSIEVDASMVDLGLADDGTLEVPSDFDAVGWYTGRSAPGDPGTSVVVGHVDDWDGPAVFFRLRHLEPGDVLEVERDDGTVAEFRVTEVEAVEKDEFPTNRVYDTTAEPTLRLLTCGGEFDHDTESYEGNLIVFAEHVGNRPVA